MMLEANKVCTIDKLDTIEHNQFWYDKAREEYRYHPIVNVIYENVETEFFSTVGFYAKCFGSYDLVFVDSINRERVLPLLHGCLSDSGVVVLHDAERGRYQRAIRQYKHQIWEDGGHTVILTNDDYAFKILSAGSV